MEQKKYSVSEIDQMRKSVTDLLSKWRLTGGHGCCGVWTKKLPSIGEIENGLRTYMVNGTEVLELVSSVDKMFDDAIDRYQEGNMTQEEYTSWRASGSPKANHLRRPYALYH